MTTPSASGRSEQRSELAAWLPVAVYSLVIVALSSLPAGTLPPSGLLRHDKLIHAAEYAVLAGLVARGVLHRAPARGVLVGFAVALAAATLFGASDELHQIFTPGREADWRDLVADGVGAVVGAAAVAVWYGRARRARSRSAGAG